MFSTVDNFNEAFSTFTLFATGRGDTDIHLFSGFEKICSFFGVGGLFGIYQETKGHVTKNL
jgi:hypothetical protein